MKFVTQNAPSKRSSNSTHKIMLYLLIGLLGVWIAAIVYHFVQISPSYGVRAILIPLVSLLATLLADIAVLSIRYKKKAGNYGEYLLRGLINEFSYVTALIFALTLPAWTPYYVVILGAIFSTVVVKHMFGGFGNNVLNPAAFGRIFVTLAFGASLAAPADLSSGLATTGATVTTAFNSSGGWFTGAYTNLNASLGDLFLGNHIGALGETFTLLILVIGIVFIALRVINWRTPVFYLGTVVLTSILIALINGLHVGQYVLLQLSLGGLVFGAVFMLTDPVTSPTSPFGKALIGVIAGLVNMLIRVQGGFPEGTVFAIAIANILTPLIDGLTKGKTSEKLGLKWGLIGGLLVVSLGLNGGLSAVHARDYEGEEVKPWPDEYPQRAYALAVDIAEEEFENYTFEYPFVANTLSKFGVQEIVEFYQDGQLSAIGYHALVGGYSTNPDSEYSTPSGENDLNFYVGFKDGNYAGFVAGEHKETEGFGGEWLTAASEYLPGKASTTDIAEINADITALKADATITGDAVLAALEVIAAQYSEYENKDILAAFGISSLGEYTLTDLVVEEQLSNAGVHKVSELKLGEERIGLAYYATVGGYSTNPDYGTPSGQDDLNFVVGFNGANYGGFVALENDETPSFGGEWLTAAAGYLPGKPADSDITTINTDITALKAGATITGDAVINALDIIAAHYVASLV